MNKRIFAWCLFDFANSSYSAVVAAVIYPVYYTNEIVGNESGMGDLWWGWAISLSMVLVAISSPFLGALADKGSLRKRFLVGYTMVCVCSVAALWMVRPSMAFAGFLLVILANIGMEGGLVFYNAYLPVIAESGYVGRVSAWGFGIGYAGSILSLLLALVMIQAGLMSLVWPMVSLFFLVFAMPAFLLLPHDRVAEERAGVLSVRASVAGMRKLFVSVWRNSGQRRFLIAYLLFEDGVNTVIVFSSIFAATTLHFATQELIGLYILVQVTALAGAFAMARYIDLFGPKRIVMWALGLWTSVSVLSFFIYSKPIFFGIAALAGAGLGVIQAASRALYAMYIPEGREAEHFGIYSLVGKSSAVLGPAVFGMVSSGFGSQRPAVLAISMFFLGGLAVLKPLPSAGFSREVNQ